jgi:PAS domain S-box-containing protein
MGSKKRNAIVSWALVGITLALAASMLPEALASELSLQAGVTVLAVALLHNLGLPLKRYGASTFLPVMALAAYLSLGLAVGLWVIIVGLVVGAAAIYVRQIGKIDAQTTWWVALGSALWPVAANGLGLWLADFAYRAFGAAPPLTRVAAPEMLLPFVAAAVLYLLVYNFMLTLDVWLAGQKWLAFYADNRRALLSVQMLPLPLAPLIAVALTTMGLPAYLILITVLLAIAIAVNRLVVAQTSLSKQVRRLSSFSSVGRAVRATLELRELLETVYLQTAHLLSIENFYVALLQEDTNQLHFPLVVRDGHREARPWSERQNTFAEWVIDQRRPLLIADGVEQTAARMGLNPPERGLSSWMGVPLLSADRALGCMATYTVGDSPRVFDEEDLELFSNVAAQASVSVENALLYRNARQHARQLATVSEISTVMNASLDPDQVLNLVSGSIIQVAGCDKAAIYLLEEDGDEDSTLQLAHAEGFSEGYATISQTLSVPLSDRERDAVLETGEVIAVPDIRTASDVAPGLVALAESEKFRAYANFPLRAHGHPIGLLAVYYDTSYRFDESELELLQTFANQAALAVANARRYTVTDKALTRRVDQIMALADINRRLSATLELDRVFHLVVDSAMEASNAIAGLLAVADENDGKIRIGSYRGYPKDVIQRWQRGNKPGFQGISGRVLKTGQVALVDDVTRDPDFVSMGVSARSQLSVPVILEERVIGVITLESDQESMFAEEDVTFVAQLANQAGIAIKNARLYRKLGEVNDRMHAVLDASTDGLLMLDRQCRIVMTNTRMEKFWDFARSDFKERSIDEFVADPLSALGEGLGYAEGELNKLITRAVRDPDMPEENDLYVVGGQTARFVERSMRPVQDEFGDMIGLLLVFRDVTEQKELEEARENLANMIVHDLRNPLTAVLASLALVNNAAADKDETGVVSKALGVSSRAVRKLLVMVNNLLDMGRLETGEFTPEQRAASIKGIFENVVGEMLPLAMEMEVMIEVDNASVDKVPDVNVDRDMIERVIWNLMDNALKFSPSGSKVTLRAVALDAKTDGETGDEAQQFVQIEVIDSGPGIPDDYKGRIFERYKQVSGQKGRGRGTGLGLAFCRLAVDAHDGRIWVEDNEGGGSVFRFTLPVAPGSMP